MYRNPDRFSIIDPNNEANDIAGGASNTHVVRYEFRQALHLLQRQMGRAAADPARTSILGTILEGNYDSFYYQRELLREMHVKKFGYCPDE